MIITTIIDPEAKNTITTVCAATTSSGPIRIAG